MILITGPESTGKSTLAEQLSRKLGITCIQEYSRHYFDTNGPDYDYADIETMAREHHDHIINSDQSQLILDTFALNYKIWSIYKYGKVSPVIMDMLSYYNYDKVLLLKPDIPWEPDPLRENPQNRQELFEIYVKELNALGWDYDIIEGHGKDRLANALRILE